jgi:hypothetical protein
MITFFGTWFALASIALVFNYFIQSINPRDDED